MQMGSRTSALLARMQLSSKPEDTVYRVSEENSSKNKTHWPVLIYGQIAGFCQIKKNLNSRSWHLEREKLNQNTAIK